MAENFLRTTSTGGPSGDFNALLKLCT